MRVVFRVDASVDIGTGHLMRCLTLADALKRNGAEVDFVSATTSTSLAQLVRRRGYRHLAIDPAPGDVVSDAEQTATAVCEGSADEVAWLVVDHYGLDASWESRLRPMVASIMVIDDLANRLHDCDLLLDQNYYAGFESRYAGLVGASTRCLLGPAYVLLRPEFAKASQSLRRRDGTVRRILVFFGGTDATNQTQRALAGIHLLQRPDIQVDAVVGSANPYRDEVQAFCSGRPWASYHCQVSNMAELIAAADLGIGAGGATMWERCALGLPSLTVVFADNQVEATRDAAATGAIAYLGRGSELAPEDYARAVQGLMDRPSELASMSLAALKLVDASRSGTEAVVQAMNMLNEPKVKF